MDVGPEDLDRHAVELLDRAEQQQHGDERDPADAQAAAQAHRLAVHARQQFVGQEDGLFALALRLSAALLFLEHPGRQAGRGLRRLTHGPRSWAATLVTGELSHVDNTRGRGVGGRRTDRGLQ